MLKMRLFDNNNNDGVAVMDFDSGDLDFGNGKLDYFKHIIRVFCTHFIQYKLQFQYQV